MKKRRESSSVSPSVPLGGDRVTPPLEKPGPRCVAAGIDSLYLSFWPSLSREVYEALEQAKKDANEEQSEDSDELAPLVLGGETFRVAKHGAKGFQYALAAETHDWTLAIAKRASQDPAPTVYVQVLSEGLWEQGAEASLRDLRLWLQKLDTGNGDCRAVVSRIDLAADMTGVDPSEDDRRDFVTRARRVGAFYSGNTDVYWDGERWRDAKRQEVFGAKTVRPKTSPSDPVDVFWDGRDFTGFRFGKDRVVFRIYDKQAEIKKSKKTWFHEVWKARGWDGEATVWRYEAQIRREAVKEMALVDQESGEAVFDLDPEQLLKNLSGLWRYVVGDPGRGDGGWIQWKIRDDEEAKPTRWDVRPEWDAIRAVEFGVTGCAMLRVHRAEATYEQLVPMVAGVIATMGSCKGTKTIADAVKVIQPDVEKYFATRAKRNFKKTVEHKMKQLRLELNHAATEGHFSKEALAREPDLRRLKDLIDKTDSEKRAA